MSVRAGLQSTTRSRIMTSAASSLSETTTIVTLSRQRATSILLLLLLLVTVPHASAGLSRLCGQRLTETMRKLCTPHGSTTSCFKGAASYPDVGKRPSPHQPPLDDETTTDDDKHELLHWWLNYDFNRRPTGGGGGPTRYRRASDSVGIATECCEHGCSYKYMLSFCCDTTLSAPSVES